jgi:hypothetical protein
MLGRHLSRFHWEEAQDEEMENAVESSSHVCMYILETRDDAVRVADNTPSWSQAEGDGWG